jgi:hypothetical protein
MTDYSLLKVYTELPGLSLTARFYQDPPDVEGGAGGYEAVPRPQSNAVTAWRGFSDGFTMSLNLILDSYAARPPRDIENDCGVLDKMAGALGRTQPPLLILDAGGALQHDVVNRPAARWVISDPPAYADVLRNADGRRVRQVVTVKFMLYIAYDGLSRTVDVSRIAPKNTFIVTSSIPTFKAAAAKYLKSYGGAKWGNRLAQLNGLRDGTATLPPGQRFKLPTPAQVKAWEKTPRR